jgi:hypothetical protein
MLVDTGTMGLGVLIMPVAKLVESDTKLNLEFAFDNRLLLNKH